MSLRDELLAANTRYRATFALGDLPREPRRRLVVVTCMDARIDPLAIVGLELGDAHVLRNAGAVVTDDVLRSLAISHAVLGTEEALVIGHTGCGLEGASNDELRALVGAGSDVDFLPFPDVEESVRAGVRRIRSSHLLPSSFGASGYVYDVTSGALRGL
ncbi:MAG: carbonic anhydrase [Gaiellaceae bacterium]|nr:carbonic anhydrase [Gaiellaceae bacterium]